MTKKTDFYHTKWSDPGYRCTPVCVYCGKTLTPCINHNGTYFWHCNCSDAEKERELQLKIQEIKKQMPKPKYEATREWQEDVLCPVVKEIKYGKEKE